MDQASLVDKEVRRLQVDIRELLNPPVEVVEDAPIPDHHPEVTRTSWKVYFLVALGSIVTGGLVLIGYLIFLGIRHCMRPKVEPLVVAPDLPRVPDPVIDRVVLMA